MVQSEPGFDYTRRGACIRAWGYAVSARNASTPAFAAQVTTSNAVSFQMCPDYVGSPFYPNDSKAGFGYELGIRRAEIIFPITPPVDLRLRGNGV